MTREWSVLRSGTSSATAVALLLLLAVSTENAAGHGVVIGQNSEGRLSVHIEAAMPVELHPSTIPGVDGWADTEPGITSAEINEPKEDIFLLDLNCNVQFILVSFDPGVQIVTSHVWVPGETFDFGPPFFDYHLVFNIIPGGEIGTTYALRFRLHDTNGVLTDSPEYELLFTPVAAHCHCRGDTNHDKEMSAKDVQSFTDCLMEEHEHFRHADCACADIDADGHVDSTDIEMFVDQLIASESCE